MKKKKKYLMLSLVISILLGVALPLAMGLKAPYLMAITFLSFWFGYGLVMLVKEKFLKKYHILPIGFSIAGILAIFGLGICYFLRALELRFAGLEPSRLDYSGFYYSILHLILILLATVIFGILTFTLVTYLKKRK